MPPGNPGHFRPCPDSKNIGDHHHHHHQIDTWDISNNNNNNNNEEEEATLAPLREAAALLRQSDIPVAFPTETVYGLGADATRSSAVKGIYAAKGRPSDNPLIVHVCDLDMLRGLLRPKETTATAATTITQHQEESTSSSSSSSLSGTNGHGVKAAATVDDDDDDPIPEMYRPLLARFWPGPLTILLRAPCPSSLAPEVTAGLPTFGARMPASPLARTLIKLAGQPLAAPSANASTKPSPTAASHVRDDLGGRIELILDGGRCSVGVESTVVDGLCEDGGPPVVLRPGGVSLGELRAVPGWEATVKGYRDESEEGKSAKDGGKGPRAPGMKYKHYSPRARVVLFEAKGSNDHGGGDDLGSQHVGDEIKALETSKGVVGVIRTLKWEPVAGGETAQDATEDGEANLAYKISTSALDGRKVLDIALGHDTKTVAQGLFSALRELDRKGADIIFVEGVEDKDDIAAAVMNRLRKAASEIRT